MKEIILQKTSMVSTEMCTSYLTTPRALHKAAEEPVEELLKKNLIKMDPFHTWMSWTCTDSKATLFPVRNTKLSLALKIVCIVFLQLWTTIYKLFTEDMTLITVT